MHPDDQDVVARLARAEQAAAEGEADRAIQLLAEATELLSARVEAHASGETSAATSAGTSAEGSPPDRRRRLADDLAAVERALQLAATWETATRAELDVTRGAQRFAGPQSDSPRWIHERA